MSSEARTIRPFKGLGLFEQALSRACLHFGTDVCEPGRSIYSDLDAHGFQLRPVDVAWAKNADEFQSFKNELHEAVNQIQIDPSRVGLVILAETKYLKESEILLNHPLSQLPSLRRVQRLTHPDDRPNPFRAWRHGFRVQTLVLLNQSIQPAPLRPWRMGTWFAQSIFDVKTTHSSKRLFRPLPLNDEARKKLSLPANTARFVSLGDHDPLQAYEEQVEEPEFYIDADLLSELNASSAASPSSKAVQLDLVLYFISVIIQNSSRRLIDEKPSLEDISDSVTARIIQLCVGSVHDKEGMNRIYSYIKNRPEQAIAIAEDKLKLRSALISNVKQND